MLKCLSFSDCFRTHIYIDSENKSVEMEIKTDEIDDDETLMQRVGENNVNAYRVLVSKHLNRALNFAERMIGDRSEAEDITQEAFLKVWRQARKWKPKAKFTTWFHRVLYNLCVDYHRKPRLLADRTEVDATPSVIPNPEQIYQSNETSNHLRRALQKLPENQRAALILSYYEGLNQVEAAQILEVSVSAVETLLFRARNTLRQTLKGIDYN